jgi:hypothetical protein
LRAKAEETYTEIRLFTRGKKEKAVERKKKLARKLHRVVTRMHEEVKGYIEEMGGVARGQYEEELALYRKMLGQIKAWMNTGFHPSGKIISLWYQDARAITRGKAARAVEFGRRWFITLLEGGYIIGGPCKKVGSDTDGKIAKEVLPQFIQVLGKMPDMFVYDRGGDEVTNHRILKKAGVKKNCIFRKGKGKMDVGPRIFTLAKRGRARSEAAIATIKCGKYDFNKPRARSGVSCATKGYLAIFGANVNRLIRDLRGNPHMSEAV